MELFVDLFKIEEVVVRNIRFREEHIHMSRHATSDGVNGESYAPAALLNQFGELAYRMLRLRHRHAVSRDDDHVARVANAHCGIFGADAARGEPLGALHRGGRLLATKRTEEDVCEAAIHRLRHEDREDEAARAIQGAGDDQDVVADRKARGARRESRIGVEE